jgi:mannose-1-phosphate guanylyltransferase/mannose-6-phosphate isomerase
VARSSWLLKWSIRLARLKREGRFSAPIVVCKHDHRFLVPEELARAHLQPQAILLEPVGRNTAPAVAAAALFAQSRDVEAILLVMPSDHVICNTVGFLNGVVRAAEIAGERLVLFGIEPNEPHTDYGYIRKGHELNGADSGIAVDAFCEKPDREKAEDYLNEDGYFWNSGIFVLLACAYLGELERLNPAICAAARDALNRAEQDMEFLRLEPKAFAASPSISIDYAVMEKMSAAANAAAQRRLERRGLVVVPLGHHPPRRAGQRRRGRRHPRRYQGLPRAQRALARRRHRGR